VSTPAHTYPTTMDSGSYTVTLLVVNEFGCIDETELDVYITPHISLYVPNAFSPNEDRHNNTFRAYGENIVKFEMHIFNRWGQEIFYSAVMENGWDGTFMGKQVENDVYVYKIYYEGLDGTSGTPSGSVTLLR
jgi:gliding motility-associated-like protein